MKRTDLLFNKLIVQIPWPTQAKKRQWWRLWISDETWKLVDECAAFSKHNFLQYDQVQYQRLSCQVKHAFKVDQWQCIKTTGAFINARLELGNLQGAWSKLKAWYRDHSNCPIKPSLLDLEAVTTERQDL